MALAEPAFGLGSAREFLPLTSADLRYQRPNSEDSSSERATDGEEEGGEKDDEIV